LAGVTLGIGLTHAMAYVVDTVPGERIASVTGLAFVVRAAETHPTSSALGGEHLHPYGADAEALTAGARIGNDAETASSRECRQISNQEMAALYRDRDDEEAVLGRRREVVLK
jgi:hypothetical protein